MNQIKKVLRKFGIRYATWKDVVKCKLANRNYINSLKNDTLIRSLNIDWAKFWQEMAHNPNALIYQLDPFKSVNPEVEAFTKLDYTFPKHSKKIKYDKGEKNKSEYLTDSGQIYFRKIRDYQYYESLTPKSVKITMQWFDNAENVIFEGVRNIEFPFETDAEKFELVKKRNARLSQNLNQILMVLGNSGELNLTDLGTLQNLVFGEMEFYRKGEIMPLIAKFGNNDFKAQTPFLSDELRQKIIDDLTITNPTKTPLQE